MQVTYTLKESINRAASNNIEIIDEIPQRNSSLNDDQFGTLTPFNDGQYHITYHDTSLILLDRNGSAIIGQNHSFGRIIDVAVCDEEVFVLRDVSKDALFPSSASAGIKPIVRVSTCPPKQSRSM